MLTHPAMITLQTVLSSEGLFHTGYTLLASVFPLPPAYSLGSCGGGRE